jgi:hypothetical protein
MAKDPVIVVPTEEDNILEGTITTLNEKLKANYLPVWYRSFVNISYEVAKVGLPLKEACILNDVDYEQFLQMMEKDPDIKQLIDKKTLEYKRSLLKVVSHKATTDDKIALDLLMARFPDEFNKRKGSANPEGEGNNVVNMAINFIQQNGDKRPLVSSGSGKATAVEVTDEKAKNRQTIMERLSKLLS